MTKKQAEKVLAEYLDERWQAVSLSRSEQMQMVNEAHYRGARSAIAQIGGWICSSDGIHTVSLDFSKKE